MLKFQIEIFTNEITYGISAAMPLAKNFDLEEIGNGITISPAHLDGDGLYIATFRRS